jgi:hypothetical protein
MNAGTDHGGASRALLLTRLLRATILVVCGIAAVAAWMAGATTVVGLAVVIAAEETWETSVVVAALRRQLRGEPLPRHGIRVLAGHRS